MKDKRTARSSIKFRPITKIINEQIRTWKHTARQSRRFAPGTGVYSGDERDGAVVDKAQHKSTVLRKQTSNNCTFIYLPDGIVKQQLIYDCCAIQQLQKQLLLARPPLKLPFHGTWFQVQNYTLPHHPPTQPASQCNFAVSQKFTSFGDAKFTSHISTFVIILHKKKCIVVTTIFLICSNTNNCFDNKKKFVYVISVNIFIIQ